MGEELFADIIIDISHEALDKVFQYRVPFSLRGAVTPGVRVCVPFGAGNREREGYVIAVTEQAKYDRDKIKEILRISEGSLTVESQLIQVAAFFEKTIRFLHAAGVKDCDAGQNKSTAPSGSHPVS